ncbi:MAG: AarF/ABC1/UbiB kinase family protein [Acidobacteria bacterium]|nr:AarF/ABC1/UbiB kinase family protein [Acidobacteriota bacterium]
MRALQYLIRTLQVLWIGLGHLAAIQKDRVLKRAGISGPEHLRIALEQMSGSFLKFGQILSLQVDVLPREYCDTLLDLLDRVPPFPSEPVKQVFVEELGRPPEALYLHFDYQPLASASIGQVHRATLRDGTLAAVKVQRPGIQQIFMRDAALLRLFVKAVFFLRIRSLYFMRDPVREFNEWIQDELDYRREAAYADMLGKNARETPTESVPRIHWSLTTSRILTMDFLPGYSVLEYLRIRTTHDPRRLSELSQIGFDPARFVSNVITNFVSDAFHFGVFHADLHPANLLILKDNVVGYVDFGIVGTLTSEARRKAIQLTLAYVGGKTEDIYTSFLDICTVTPDADLAAFRQELERRSRSWYKEPPIGGIPRFGKSLTLAMIDLLAMVRNYGVLPNREMIKYIRSLFLTDGLVSRLAPGLDLGPQLVKLCEDYIAGETKGKVFSRKATLTLLADISGWLQSGPGALLRALDLLERRQLRLRTHLIERHDRRSRLRTRAILAAIIWCALFASAALNWRTFFQQNLSTPGYLAAGFLLGWTFWILRLLRRLARD